MQTVYVTPTNNGQERIIDYYYKKKLSKIMEYRIIKGLHYTGRVRVTLKFEAATLHLSLTTNCNR